MNHGGIDIPRSALILEFLQNCSRASLLVLMQLILNEICFFCLKFCFNYFLVWQYCKQNVIFEEFGLELFDLVIK